MTKNNEIFHSLVGDYKISHQYLEARGSRTRKGFSAVGINGQEIAGGQVMV